MNHALILIMILACAAFVIGFLRFARETHLLIENLEFYLKQRTVSHNRDRAKMAIYKSKWQSLMSQSGQVSRKTQTYPERTQDKQLQDENMKLKIENEGLKKEIKKIKKHEKSLQKDNDLVREELSGLREKNSSLIEKIQSIQSENNKPHEKEKFYENKVKDLSSQIFILRESLQKVGEEKNHLNQQLRIYLEQFQDPPKESAQKSPKVNRNDFCKSVGEHLNSKIAESFEVFLKERIKQDLEKMLNLEKEIIALKAHSSGQENSLLEVERLASQIKKTRESLYDSKLSIQALDSLNLEDVI